MPPKANEEEISSIPLSRDTWIGYGPDNDGRYQRLEFDSIETEDAEEAARQFAAQAWASGTHRIMVVNVVCAREFEVSLETTEVVVNDAPE